MVRCVHGDLKPYMMTKAEVEIQGVQRTLQVGVVPNLAHEMFSGRDCEGIEKSQDLGVGSHGD